MADYFTTLCKTDEHGFCMFLIERPSEDFSLDTKPIKVSYSAAAGTAYVIMDEVVVPPENLVGTPGQGFYQTMGNFNIERWQMGERAFVQLQRAATASMSLPAVIIHFNITDAFCVWLTSVVGGNRHSRMIVEECMKWSMQRNVFGKPLIQQPVIRFKLGQMIADVEAVHSMLEDMTYQMVTLSEGEINANLAGPIALLKYKQTRVATTVSDHACQIFGGRVSMPHSPANASGALTHPYAVCGAVGTDAYWHGIDH